MIVTRLTPQEVLQALIDGKDVEYRHYTKDNTDSHTKDNMDNRWEYLHGSCSISRLTNDCYQFRLAQNMIKIGDVSFPKPYQGEIEYDEIYYVPQPNCHLLYAKAAWNIEAKDRMMMSRGLVHLSKESAIAKALIRLSGGCVE